MAVPVRLSDLFGDFLAAWPSTTLRDHIGMDSGVPPSTAGWLDKLDRSITVTDIRTGATGAGVAVEAQLRTTGFLTYPLGWPFNFTSMPDVLFKVLPFGNLTDAIGLFASVSDDGVELVVEGVPVEIQLPTGLITPPDTASSAQNTKTVGSFTAGSRDALKIVYNEDAPTSIFVHVRVRATAGGEYEIETAVPISFEACRLSGLPATAVHDFRLIPSPGLAPSGLEWVRHPLDPWWPAGSGPYDGLFGFRSLDLDTKAEPLHRALERLRTMNTEGPPTGSTAPSGVTPKRDSGTELVLADTVVPWFSPWVIPVPRHITVGLRRRVLDPSDPHQVYDFAKAPVNVRIARQPAINFIVDSFFYRSKPFDELETDLGLTFSAAVVVGDDTSDPYAFGVGLAESYTVRTSYRRQFIDERVPVPGDRALLSFHQALHFEIADTVTVDVIGFQIGYSIGKAVNEGADFADCAELTVDLWVAMKPTGGEGGAVTLRGLSGEDVVFAIEALGWRQGSFHLEGVAMPDGVVVMFANIVGILIQELAVVAEQGASYFSISAGLLLKLPNGFEGGAGVIRLRFRIAGNQSAPSWKLDGFWVLAKGPTFLLEAGGFYKDELVGDTRVKDGDGPLVILGIVLLTGGLVLSARRTEWFPGARFGGLAAVGIASLLFAAVQPDGAGYAGVYFVMAIGGIRLDRDAAIIVCGGTVVGLVAIQLVEGTNPAVIAGILFSVLPWFLVMRLIRRLGQNVEELRESRAAHAESAALAERSRVARELHDVLAHSLSALALQLEGTRLLARKSDADAEVIEGLERAHHLAGLRPG